MADLPEYLTKSAEEFLQDFQNDVVAISKGNFYDFSDSSFLTVLGEALALKIKRLNESQVELLPYIKASLLESLGFVRLIGTKAIVSVRFQLQNKTTRSFPIQPKTRFSLNIGSTVLFETQNYLEIPANIDTTDPNNYKYCRVSAIALESGIKGNQPIQRGGIVQIIDGLDSVWIDEPSKGGNDEETPDQFFNRVSQILRKFLENQFSLVQTFEFEQATREVLGLGSVAIGIPDIAANQIDTQLASMQVFCLNPDFSTITNAQKQDLISKLSPRAPLVQGRLYFNSLTPVYVDIRMSIKIDSSANTQKLLNDINVRLRTTFSIINTIETGSLEYYLAIHQVFLAGAIEPILTWRKDIDVYQGRNLPLPRIVPSKNYTQPAKIRNIQITVEPNGITTTFTE